MKSLSPGMMRKNRPTACLAGMLTLINLITGHHVVASESSADQKNQYHLFNPTPSDLLRPLSTDRPDLTESPYTVDAGHFQFEMDVLNYSYDRYHPDGVNRRVETVRIAPVNLKLGLLNHTDLQWVLQPYTSVRSNNLDTGRVIERSGFDDLITRLKINLWGNDGGPTALGLLPFVKIPTNADDLGNHSVEGGLIVPFAAELPRGWGLGMQTGVEFVRDTADHDYDSQFIHSIAVGHGIVGNLSGYVEFFSVVPSTGDSDWEGTFGTGVTYALSEDIQLDGGMNFGLTRAAPDYNPFFGVSWRF